jgi:chorismate dehydratase
MGTKRIGTVGYLNAKPLTAYIDCSRYELVEGHPCDIASQLTTGHVDVALVPVATVLDNPSLRISGRHCIGAEGPVESVFLVAERPLEEWDTVLLDGVSRTSAVLARILLNGPLADRVSDRLQVVKRPPGVSLESLEGTTAGLVIGDKARALPERLKVRLDLAEIWTQWTGLPFVFAVWAGNEGATPEMLAHIRESGDAGLAERASVYEGRDKHYVTHSIRYALDDRALIGLRRFAALAFDMGLVKDESVQMFEPSVRTSPLTSDNEGVLSRLAAGREVSLTEMMSLTLRASVADLGMAADQLRQQKCGSAGASVRWARGITVSNITEVPGEQGAFFVDADHPGAMDREPKDIRARVAELVAFGGRDVILVGGVSSGWDVERWVTLLQSIAPQNVRMFALSVDAIREMASQKGEEPETVAQQLKEAGLTGLAEGCALSLGAFSAGKNWMDAANIARDWGLNRGVVLEYGFGESVQNRVEALYALRDAGNVEWFRVQPASPNRPGAMPSSATAMDHLQMVALARLILGEVADHWAVWIPGTTVIAQVGLQSGCNGLGTVVLPENPENWPAYTREVARLVRDSGTELLVNNEAGMVSATPVVTRSGQPLH